MFLTRRLALWQHLEREHRARTGCATGSATTRSPPRRCQRFRTLVPEHGAVVPAPPHVLDEHILATAVAEGRELRGSARGQGRDARRLRPYGDVRARRRSDRDGLCPLGPRRHRPRHLPRQAPGVIDRTPGAPHGAVSVPLETSPHRRARRPRTAGARPAATSARGASPPTTTWGTCSWTWSIPLGNGLRPASRRLRHPASTSPRQGAGERYLAFLKQSSLLAERTQGARMRAEELRTFSNLGLRNPAVHGHRLALLGDAAAFIDPTTRRGSTTRRSPSRRRRDVKAQHDGEDVAARIAEHNLTFIRSYTALSWRSTPRTSTTHHGGARPGCRLLPDRDRPSTTSSW